MKAVVLWVLAGVSCLNHTIALEQGQKATMKEQDVKIPFIFEKRQTYPSSLTQDRTNSFKAERGFQGPISSYRSQGRNYMDKITEEVAEFSASKLKVLIKSFKEDICQVNPNGEFEITFKVDASGKILGIGFAGESGLKAFIRCG